MIRGISHLGIAVPSLDEAIHHYTALFDREPDSVEELPERGVRLCVFRVGGTEVELVEPSGPQGESIRRFLRRKGEGIHHICLEVEDIQTELRRLQEEGFVPIGQPRRGSLGRVVAFLRPTRGVLIELVETRHAEQPLEDKPD